MAAKPHRNSASHDLDHPADGIAGRLRRIDRLNHAAAGLRVEAADRRSSGGAVDVSGIIIGLDPSRLHASEGDDVAGHADSELGQQPLGYRPGRHPCRGLASAGTLEDIPGIATTVLEEPDQIGMPGAR